MTQDDLNKYLLAQATGQPAQNSTPISDSELDALMGKAYPTAQPLVVTEPSPAPASKPLSNLPQQYDAESHSPLPARPAPTPQSNSAQLPRGVQLGAMLTRLGESQPSWTQAVSATYDKQRGRGNGYQAPSALSGIAAGDAVIDSYKKTHPTIDPVTAAQYQQARSAMDPNSRMSRSLSDYLKAKGIKNTDGMSYSEMANNPAYQPNQGLDPLKAAQVSKTQAETEKLRADMSDKSTEADRKKILVDAINTQMKKEVAFDAMSIKTLEDMASDVGLDPLKLRRAAAGANRVVYGKNVSGAYDEARNPEVVKARVASDNEDMGYLTETQRNYVGAIQASNLPSQEKERLIEPKLAEARKIREKEQTKARDIIFDVSGDAGPGSLIIAIRQMKETLRGSTDADWGLISKAVQGFKDRPIGQWVINLAAAKAGSKEREILQNLSLMKQAYARPLSGAAISESEWNTFAMDLGVQALSSTAMMYAGISRTEKYVTNKIASKWRGVHSQVRKDPEFSERMSEWTIQSSEDNQSTFDGAQ